MEQITQISAEKLQEISDKALAFVKEKISTDGQTNWETIYDLKRQLLMCGENRNCLARDMMSQAKRREQQHNERLQHALDAQKELSDAYEAKIKVLEARVKEYERIIQNRAK